MSDESKVEVDTSAGGRRKAPCGKCGRITNHEVLVAVIEYWSNEEQDVDGTVRREIIRCLGCDTQRFLVEHGCSDDRDPESGEFWTSVTTYPKELLGTTPYERGLKLPEPISRLSGEVRSAIAEDNTTLAAIGMRALVEAVCKAEGAKGRNLEERIRSLVELGRIGSEGAGLLDPIREVGNDAAHDAKAPERSELLTALAVVDHLLDGVYLLKEGVERMKRGLLKRRTKGNDLHLG